MKKNLITSCIVLLACVWLTGCKKESSQSINAVETNDVQVGNNSSCKLTYAIVWAPAIWDFTYNDKGLADIWRINYAGSDFNFKLEYDKFNKLIKADAYDDFNNLIQSVTFSYSGNLLIKETWTFIDGTNLEYLF